MGRRAQRFEDDIRTPKITVSVRKGRSPILRVDGWEVVASHERFIGRSNRELLVRWYRSKSKAHSRRVREEIREAATEKALIELRLHANLRKASRRAVRRTTRRAGRRLMRRLKPDILKTTTVRTNMRTGQSRTTRR